MINVTLDLSNIKQFVACARMVVRSMSTVVPILHAVRIEPTEQDCIALLTMTDIECVIRQTVPYVGTLPRALVVAWQRIFGCKWERKQVEICETDTGVINTRTAENQPFCEVATFCGADWPDTSLRIMPLTAPKMHTLAPAFLEQLRAVSHAWSTEETRDYLNGVFIGADMVATDGHRLAKFSLTDYPFFADEPAIIPRRQVEMLLKLKKGQELAFGIIPRASGIPWRLFKAETGGFMIYTRVIDGKFPDYSRFIPSQDARNIISVDTQLLIDAVKPMAVPSGYKSRACALEFAADALHVWAENNDDFPSERRIVVYANHHHTPVGNVHTFDLRYIKEALLATNGGGTVTFYCHECEAPLFMRADTPLGILDLVIMPFRAGKGTCLPQPYTEPLSA